MKHNPQSHSEPHPVQPIRVQGIRQGGQQYPRRKRSWHEAYKLYKANPDEGKMILTITKVLAVWLPINVVDDVIPVLGQLDDPLYPVTVLVGAIAAWRINRYR